MPMVTPKPRYSEQMENGILYFLALAGTVNATPAFTWISSSERNPV